jgi:hypothetical protein
VTDWDDFQTAYKNSNVSKIILANDITRGSGDTDLSTGSYSLARSLKVTSEDTDAPVTLDFGADSGNANAFDLGGAAAGAKLVLNLHDLEIVHLGSDFNDAVVYDGVTTASQTAGWTVELSNINNGSTDSGAALVTCRTAPADVDLSNGTSAGDAVNTILSGTVTWHTTNDYTTFSAGNLAIQPGAVVDVETTSLNDTDGFVFDMSGSVSIGKGAKLTVKNNTLASGAGAFVGILAASMTIQQYDALSTTPDINVTTPTGYGIMIASSTSNPGTFNILGNVNLKVSAWNAGIYVGKLAAVSYFMPGSNSTITTSASSGDGIYVNSPVGAIFTDYNTVTATSASGNAIESAGGISFSNNDTVTATATTTGTAIKAGGSVSFGTDSSVTASAASGIAIGSGGSLSFDDYSALPQDPNLTVTSTTGKGVVCAGALTFGTYNNATFTCGNTAISSTGTSSGMNVGKGSKLVIHDCKTSTVETGISLDHSTTTSPGYLSVGDDVTLSVFQDASQVTAPTDPSDFSTISCSAAFSGTAIDAGGVAFGSDDRVGVYSGTIAFNLGHPTGSSLTGPDANYNSYFQVGSGSTCNVYSYGYRGIWINADSSTSDTVEFLVDGANFNCVASGVQTNGRYGQGVVRIVGGSGSAPTTFENGAQVLVQSQGNSSGVCQFIQGDDVFTVDGSATRVKLQNAYGTGWDAALFLGAPAGTLSSYAMAVNVTDGAHLDAIRLDETGANDAPGILFEHGGTFTVSGGSHLYVHHYGGTDTGGNSLQAIEFYDQAGAGTDYTAPVEFSLTGAGSSVTLIADQGVPFTTESNPTTINVGAKTTFVADGHTSTAGQAVFDLADIYPATVGTLNFTAASPSYFDFANSASNGTIFNCAAGSSFKMTNSDLAVWKTGADFSKTADHSWTMLDDLELSGADLTTMAHAPSNPTDFASVFDKISDYGRMDANNTGPYLDSVLTPLTNADTYVRWLASVEEAPDASGVQVSRGVLNDEAYAVVDITHGGNTTTGTVGSLESDSLYRVQTGVATETGVLRYGDGTTPLIAGDKYSIETLWRGAADATKDARHEGTDKTGDGGAATVYDVLPPGPLTVNTVHSNDDTISGTWTKDNVTDGGDKPAYIYYQLTDSSGKKGTMTLVNATISDAGSGNSGTWSFKAPDDMADGDSLQVFAADNGSAADQSTDPISGLQIRVDSSGKIVSSGGTIVNLEPAADTAYHDTTIPAAASVTVAAKLDVLTLSGGDSWINFGNLNLAQSVPAKYGTDICINSNLAAGYHLQVTSSTPTGQLSLGGSAGSSGLDGQIPWGNAAGGQGLAWHVMLSPHAAGNPQDLSPKGTVQAPFTSLSDTADPGPVSSNPVTVISAGSGVLSADGGDYFTPTYGLAIYGGLQSGTYATTLTYTLSPNT